MTEEEIRRDIAPFIDPATELLVEVDSMATIGLCRQGELLRLKVELPSGRVTLTSQDGRVDQYPTIQSLLASRVFADLRSFAASQIRVQATRQGGLDTFNTQFEMDGRRTERAEVLQEVRRSSTGRTRVVVIDGPAGIGKTHFLERLALDQAEALSLDGKSSPLLLHISSRGSRLSNLRDVIAKTTQILRARFSFEEVPVLVRHELLLLAIDGFDELVDADGYRDAWLSLSEFLDEIGGAGTVLLAGRDTFFDQQGFYERLHLAQASLDVVHVRILPVEPVDARNWLLTKGWKREALESDTAEDALRIGSYVLRPFFLTELAKLGDWSALNGVSLRRRLVERFIMREARILAEGVALNEDLARDKLEDIYRDVALDMADRQADTIDIEYLSLLFEVALEGIIADDDLRKIRHKIGSIGLLERDERERLRRFPHQEVFHFVLSGGLVSEVRQGRTPPALRHCVLGGDFLEVFSEEIQAERAADIDTFIRRLKASLELERAGDRLSDNGAALIVTALSRPSTTRQQPLNLEDLSVSEVCWVNSAPVAVLRNVTIGILDARSADLTSVKFRDCTVATLTGDQSTRFGSSVPAIGLVRKEDNGLVTVLREPRQIGEWMETLSRSLGIEDDSPGDSWPLLKLLDRVCMKVIRQFAIREDAEDEGGMLLEDPLWPELETILDDAGRLERITKQMGGPAGVLVRIKNPKALLNPPAKDPGSLELRRRIVERARQLSDLDAG